MRARPPRAANDMCITREALCRRWIPLKLARQPGYYYWRYFRWDTRRRFIRSAVPEAREYCHAMPWWPGRSLWFLIIGLGGVAEICWWDGFNAVQLYEIEFVIWYESYVYKIYSFSSWVSIEFLNFSSPWCHGTTYTGNVYETYRNSKKIKIFNNSY